MILNVGMGLLIFGYAAWTIIRFVKKSKEGKCSGCSVKNSCQTSCDQ